jgi:sodium/potassium-transporting ATPase subunit alpha
MPSHQVVSPHRASVDDLLTSLDSGATGLSPEEAGRRLQEYGPNRLQAKKRFPVLRSFFKQFTHFLAVLLWIAAALSFVTEYLQPGGGTLPIGWVLIGVIVVNALFSFLQEFKADRAMQTLQQLLPAAAWVIRAGQRCQVPRTELVPGDIVLLQEGQKVPADARLLDVVNLYVDNAALTGESAPKRRTTEPASGGQPIESQNCIFAGTVIVSGHGRAVVYATGMRTEFGKIAELSALTSKDLSPLQREITSLSYVVGVISFLIGILFFVASLAMGLGWQVSAIFGIGLIAANVPEGLLPTVTFSLAMASQRMAKRQALIKQLTSVETLGCTTVICTDKTGTITENRMRVDRLYLDGTEVELRAGRLLIVGRAIGADESDHWKDFFDALAHCHNVAKIRRPDGQLVMSGSPTEVALVECVEQYGRRDGPPLSREGELAFDADRKRMTTLHRRNGQWVAFVKGAPEAVIALCGRRRDRNRLVAMTPADRASICAESRRLAEQAYRVLAIATRNLPPQTSTFDSDTIEQDLTFLGLVALRDPPHQEVLEAMSRCHRAGIRVMMITGDHPSTAVAVARQVGLVGSHGHGKDDPIQIEGVQLDAMTDDQVRRLLTPSRRNGPEPIFARMSPRQKLRIVSLLKEMGEIVAVTGDGVNDGPALRNADIGIAMGMTGTDVAKETADMILLDDNFATIVNAIEEGRAVFANIRKFVTFVFSSNVAEMFPYLCYGLFHAPLALTVPQLLAIDLGTNMVPAIALGSERPHPDIMSLPPRSRAERLMDTSLLWRVFGFLGLIEGVVALSMFFWFLHHEGWRWGEPLEWSSPLYREATTITFAAIVLGQVANAFVSRSDQLSLFRLGFFSNPITLVGIAVDVLLLSVMVYTPLGNWILGTSALPLWIWFPLSFGVLVFFLAEETRKLIVGSTMKKGSA